MKETIQILADTNSYSYNITKAAEELNELTTILLQYHNKPNKVKIKDITDEIGDVKIRLKILEKLFDSKEIQDRVDYKIGKFKGYLEKGEYVGKI